MKELKFTPENLQRHLAAIKSTERKMIITTRLEPKGVAGDIFLIKGAGYFVLIDDPEKYSGFYNICSYIGKYYHIEGFSDAEQFADELCRLYGGFPSEVYYHKLLEVFGIEEVAE